MPCAKSITGITAGCTDSHGGVRRVLVGLYGDIVGVTHATSTITDIKRATGTKFEEFEVTDQSSNLESNQQYSKTGSYYECVASLVFAEMEPAKREALDSLVGNGLVFAVLDENGRWQYVGYSRPGKLTGSTGSTGTELGDANQYTAQLTCNEDRLPLFIDPNVAEDLTTTAA